MAFIYPQWFSVENSCRKTISLLSSARELASYLHNPDKYIRRLAILRAGQLKLADSMPYLVELIENLDEDSLNRELSAWALGAVSLVHKDIFVPGKLPARFCGSEELEEVLGSTRINIPDGVPIFDISLPNNNLECFDEENYCIERDFSIENSFSFSDWLAAVLKVKKEHAVDISAKLESILAMFLSGLKNLFLRLNLSNLFAAIQLLGKKLRFSIIHMFKAQKLNRTMPSIVKILLLILLLNILWANRPLVQHADIPASELGGLLKSLSGQFFTMVSEGAADLLGTANPSDIPKQSASPETAAISLLVTAENGLFLRASPDISSPKIGSSISFGSTVSYLQDSCKDKEGRTWYKIKTPDGRIGWSSARWLKEPR